MQRDVVLRPPGAERERHRRIEPERAKTRLLRAAGIAIGFAAMAVVGAWFAYRAKNEANRQLAEVNWQLAQQARGLPFASKLSPIKATWQFIQAARASEDAGQFGSRDDALFAAHVASAHLRATFVHHGESLHALQSKDDRRIFTWSGGRTVRLWDTESGAELKLWEGHKNEVFAVAWDAATQQIASGSQDRTVRIWK